MNESTLHAQCVCYEENKCLPFNLYILIERNGTQAVGINFIS